MTAPKIRDIAGAVRTGKLHIDQVPASYRAAVEHVLAPEIDRQARWVLIAQDSEGRHRRIANQMASIRPLVEARARQLFSQKR